MRKGRFLINYSFYLLNIAAQQQSNLRNQSVHEVHAEEDKDGDNQNLPGNLAQILEPVGNGNPRKSQDRRGQGQEVNGVNGTHAIRTDQAEDQRHDGNPT